MEVIYRHEVAVGAYLARRAGREAAEDLLGASTGDDYGSGAAAEIFLGG